MELLTTFGPVEFKVPTIEEQIDVLQHLDPDIEPEELEEFEMIASELTSRVWWTPVQPDCDGDETCRCGVRELHDVLATWWPQDGDVTASDVLAVHTEEMGAVFNHHFAAESFTPDGVGAPTAVSFRFACPRCIGDNTGMHASMLYEEARALAFDYGVAVASLAQNVGADDWADDRAGLEVIGTGSDSGPVEPITGEDTTTTAEPADLSVAPYRAITIVDLPDPARRVIALALGHSRTLLSADEVKFILTADLCALHTVGPARARATVDAVIHQMVAGPRIAGPDTSVSEPPDNTA